MITTNGRCLVVRAGIGIVSFPTSENWRMTSILTVRCMDGPLHGQDGPITISRIMQQEWPTFSKGLADALEATGLNDIGDQNGVFGDGYFPTAYSNAANQRVTNATAYLTSEIRRRPNLTILSDAHVTQILFAIVWPLELNIAGKAPLIGKLATR